MALGAHRITSIVAEITSISHISPKPRHLLLAHSPEILLKPSRHKQFTTYRGELISARDETLIVLKTFNPSFSAFPLPRRLIINFPSREVHLTRYQNSLPSRELARVFQLGSPIPYCLERRAPTWLYRLERLNRRKMRYERGGTSGRLRRIPE